MSEEINGKDIGPQPQLANRIDPERNSGIGAKLINKGVTVLIDTIELLTTMVNDRDALINEKEMKIQQLEKELADVRKELMAHGSSENK